MKLDLMLQGNMCMIASSAVTCADTNENASKNLQLFVCQINKSVYCFQNANLKLLFRQQMAAKTLVDKNVLCMITVIFQKANHMERKQRNRN